MKFLELLKVILYGIVEGITEWLPISSTGHLLLVDEFATLKQPEAFKEMFFVVIQLGAILAVVVLFWHKMWPFRRRKPNQPLSAAIKQKTVSMWLKVAVACVPSAVLGLLLDDYLEAHFGNPTSIATMLIVYGVAFILIERWNRHNTPRYKTLEDITWPVAFGIGLFQVLSMIPGTSRSGATIIGALLLGTSRTAAAEFTFFLAVPTMIGASALKLTKFGFAFTGWQVVVLLVGMVVAFTVSLFVIRFLMDFIKKHDFTAFGWYRIALGIVVLVYFLLIK